MLQPRAAMIRRTPIVYGVLAAAWALIVVWQIAEHRRVKQSARAALINRSRDITTTLGVVVRSQRFRGLVWQDRLEPALKDLVKSGELSSVALLNASGEVVASAGPPIETSLLQTGEHWDEQRVTVGNLVDLGARETAEGETNRATIVLPPRPAGPPGPPGSRDRPRPFEPDATNAPSGTATNLPILNPTSVPDTKLGVGLGASETNTPAAAVPPPPSAPTSGPPPANPKPDAPTNATSRTSTNITESGRPSNPGERRPGWRRPPWMNEKEYQSLIETRGLHGVVIAMSTENVARACDQDVWMRWIIGCFATVSAGGLGLAWRNLAKSSELQMRLLRASEMNSHLKEMNLAAAGLAHETRNPLNIIRGLAQLVSKQPDAAPEIRTKLREIIDETDRVTAQLNEFINYSRPREVRWSVVALDSVIGEVARALNYDLEEKRIRFEAATGPISIRADEQLLRQALFNLLLNAIQAAEVGGQITVGVSRREAEEATLEIRDNGPGVPVHARSEIFKPYFTTHEKGTGLGLSVVQQIVLAHGWEIEYVPNEPNGAVFRIKHLKLAGEPSSRGL